MRRLLAIFMLFSCLALAACADNDKRSGDDRFGGWYSGTTGGASR
ncbi:MAG TPA: hypothetical protein VGR70_20075 [Stellaceae bacterium]|nr:hypothetical protein [Stellaceae bacterium]